MTPYAIVGGVGDILLALADAHGREDVTIYHRPIGDTTLARAFCQFFGATHVELASDQPFPDGCRRAHMPVTGDYGDWVTHPERYASIVTTAPSWDDTIGCVFLEGQRSMLVAPRGSGRSKHRRRALTHDELRYLCMRIHDYGYLPVVVGSYEDFDHYGRPMSACWLSHDRVTDSKGVSRPIDFAHFARIVNSAAFCYSVDTWLKTFIALLGRNSIVFPSRNDNGEWLPYGAALSDYLFLNPSIWGDRITLMTFDEWKSGCRPPAEALVM